MACLSGPHANRLMVARLRCGRIWPVRPRSLHPNTASHGRACRLASLCMAPSVHCGSWRASAYGVASGDDGSLGS